MPAPEYVRVKNKATGHEMSLRLSSYLAREDQFEKLDKKAVNEQGTPLRPKPNVSLPKAEGQEPPAETPPAITAPSGQNRRNS